MAKVCALYSSSKGNSTYISCGDTGILVDVGRSAKQITEALKKINADPSSISGIFITHEHTDHICGLSVFSRRFNIPVYATYGTLNELIRIGVINENDNFFAIDRNGIQIGNMFVTPFSTSHDCVDSCGYTIEMCEGRKISVCTDLGYVSQTVKDAITGSDMVVLESNHDLDMLKTGPYPYALKKRISGVCGHLSNKACADFSVYLASTGTTRFLLAHLSQENNMPQLAYNIVKSTLASAGFCEGCDYLLAVAMPSENKTVFL